MALATMLSAQTYISLMDQIDHAHNHAHFANPLAGNVEYSISRNNNPPRLHHHHGNADNTEHQAHISDGQQQPHAPAAHKHNAVADHHVAGSDTHHHSHDSADHHHGGDASFVFLVALHFVLPGAPLPAFRYETASPKLVSFNPRGPDHPPKTGPEIRV